MNINEPQGGLALPGMKKHEAVTPTQRRENQRLKAVSAIPDGFRKHFVSFCGEFVGTFLFLFFAFAGTQVANTPTTNGGLAQGPTISNIFYIAAAFGFSLLVNVWIFFRITGELTHNLWEEALANQHRRRRIQSSCSYFARSRLTAETNSP